MRSVESIFLVLILLAACDSGGMEEDPPDVQVPPAIAPFLGVWNLTQLVRAMDGNNESFVTTGTYRLQVSQPDNELVQFILQVQEGGSFVTSDIIPSFTCSTLDFSEATAALNCERFRVGRRETLMLTVTSAVLSGQATRWASETTTEWMVTLSGSQ